MSELREVLKEKPKKEKPQQLQILDDGMASGAPSKSKSKEKSPNIAMVSQQHQQQEGRKSKGETISLIPHTNASKKTTDELIEEYERKINKTKSLLLATKAITLLLLIFFCCVMLIKCRHQG